MKLKNIFIFTCLLIFFMGCMDFKQPSRQISYYTLEYDPPVISGLAPLPEAIQVKRFQASPLYDTKNIIYTEKPYFRNAYNYHKWQVLPGTMVSTLLSRDLMSYGIFSSVITDISLLNADYILEGKVDEFYEADEPDQWNAILTVSITFARKNVPEASKSILLQKSYTVVETCKEKNPESLAAALSLAMSKISQDIALDIHASASSY